MQHRNRSSLYPSLPVFPYTHLIVTPDFFKARDSKDAKQKMRDISMKNFDWYDSFAEFDEVAVSLTFHSTETWLTGHLKMSAGRTSVFSASPRQQMRQMLSREWMNAAAYLRARIMPPGRCIWSTSCVGSSPSIYGAKMWSRFVFEIMIYVQLCLPPCSEACLQVACDFFLRKCVKCGLTLDVNVGCCLFSYFFFGWKISVSLLVRIMVACGMPKQLPFYVAAMQLMNYSL